MMAGKGSGHPWPMRRTNPRAAGRGRQPFAVAGSALNHPRAGTYLLIVFMLGRLANRPPALGDQVALSRSARSWMGSMP